jgi:hypothetical protein
MTSGPDKSNPLEITGDAAPSVPAYTCIVYVHTAEDGTVIGRVANLAGIESRGASERFVLRELTASFKTQVQEMHETGREIPWIESPAPPSENERVRSIPMHL